MKGTEQERGDMIGFSGRKRSDSWTVNHEDSMTVQSDAKQADIKSILKRFGQVGIVEHLNTVEAMFMDITEFEDYADAMRHAKLAETEFMKLPSKVREIFNHDVAQWLDVAHDKEKQDELVAAGIIEDPEKDKKKVASNPDPPVERSGEAKTPPEEEAGSLERPTGSPGPGAVS